MAETFWHLQKCSLFNHLREADLSLLEAQSRMTTLKKGDSVYLPNEQADAVILVASGRVKIYHAAPEGKQSILGFVDSGEVFGELSLLGNSTRQDHAETTEKTTLVLIPKPAMLKTLHKYPSLVLSITKLIGARRQRIERRLKNLLFHCNRERVILLLLELIERYGEMTPEGLTLQIRLSHEDMASLIGSTRETVTVVLGQMQKENLLKISRRRVTVLDLEGLAKEVNSPLPAVPMNPQKLTPELRSLV